MAELYSNVNIIEQVEITPEGAIRTVYEVSARTKSNVLFRIRVPQTDFTEETVKKLLTDQATKIEKIKAL